LKKIFILLLALMILTLSFASVVFASESAPAGTKDNGVITVEAKDSSENDAVPAEYERPSSTRYVKIGLGVLAIIALFVLFTVMIKRKEPVAKDTDEKKG